jgi:hypothetical protein
MLVPIREKRLLCYDRSNRAMADGRLRGSMEFVIRSVWNIEYEAVVKVYPQLHSFHIYPNDNDYCIITINSLEELIRLKNEVKEDLIVRDSVLEKMLEIMIYDYYIE